MLRFFDISLHDFGDTFQFLLLADTFTPSTAVSTSRICLNSARHFGFHAIYFVTALFAFFSFRCPHFMNRWQLYLDMTHCCLTLLNHRSQSSFSCGMASQLHFPPFFPRELTRFLVHCALTHAYNAALSFEGLHTQHITRASLIVLQAFAIVYFSGLTASFALRRFRGHFDGLSSWFDHQRVVKHSFVWAAKNRFIQYQEGWGWQNISAALPQNGSLFDDSHSSQDSSLCRQMPALTVSAYWNLTKAVFQHPFF